MSHEDDDEVMTPVGETKRSSRVAMSTTGTRGLKRLISEEATKEWDDDDGSDGGGKEPMNIEIEKPPFDVCPGCENQLVFWAAYPFVRVGAAETLPLPVSPHIGSQEVVVDKSIVSKRGDAVPQRVLDVFYKHDAGKKTKAAKGDSKVTLELQAGGENSAEDVDRCKRWTKRQCKPVVYDSDGKHVYTRSPTEIVGYYFRSVDVRQDLQSLRARCDALVKQLGAWKDATVTREALQTATPAGLQFDPDVPYASHLYSIVAQLPDSYIQIPLARVFLRGTLDGKTEIKGFEVKTETKAPEAKTETRGGEGKTETKGFETKTETKSSKAKTKAADPTTCPSCRTQSKEWQDYPLLLLTAVSPIDLHQTPHIGGEPDRIPDSEVPEEVKTRMDEKAVVFHGSYVYTCEEKGWMLRSLDQRERLEAQTAVGSQVLAQLRNWVAKKTVVERDQLKAATSSCDWFEAGAQYLLVYRDSTRVSQVPLAHVTLVGQFKL